MEDIIDVQDRVGYVDTGISQHTLAYATPVSSHIVLKEPKPLKQVPIIDKSRLSMEGEPKTVSHNTSSAIKKPYVPYHPEDQRYSTTTKKMNYENNEPYQPVKTLKPHQVYQQPLKGGEPHVLYQQPLKDSHEQQYIQPKPTNHEQLYIKPKPSISDPQRMYQDHQQQQHHRRRHSMSDTQYEYHSIPTTKHTEHRRTPEHMRRVEYYKGKEREYTAQQYNRNIKYLIGSKLHEIADMINQIDIHDEPPRPTPSKSDPSYPHLQRQRSTRMFNTEPRHYHKNMDAYPPSRQDAYYTYEEPYYGYAYHRQQQRKPYQEDMKRNRSRRDYASDYYPYYYEYPYYGYEYEDFY